MSSNRMQLLQTMAAISRSPSRMLAGCHHDLIGAFCHVGEQDGSVKCFMKGRVLLSRNNMP